MVCPQCGSATKVVPAGYSKSTGKPYNAFTSCTNRQCRWTGPAPAQQAPQARKVATQGMTEVDIIKSKSMVLAYAKDEVVQEMASGTIPENIGARTTGLAEQLWAWVIQDTSLDHAPKDEPTDTGWVDEQEPA